MLVLEIVEYCPSQTAGDAPTYQNHAHSGLPHKHWGRQFSNLKRFCCKTRFMGGDKCTTSTFFAGMLQDKLDFFVARITAALQDGK